MRETLKTYKEITKPQDCLNFYFTTFIVKSSFQASVVERDAVFIPTGWDSEAKISILYPNMTTGEFAIKRCPICEAGKQCNAAGKRQSGAYADDMCSRFTALCKFDLTRVGT